MKPISREQLTRFTIEAIRGEEEWSEVDVLRVTKGIDVVLEQVTRYGLDLEGPFVLTVVREEVAGVDT